MLTDIEKGLNKLQRSPTRGCGGGAAWDRVTGLWMEKGKEQSMFRAEAPGMGLFLISILGNFCAMCQFIQYHYCTIKWLIILLLSIYAKTCAITQVIPCSRASVGHARVLDKGVSLFEGGALRALVNLSALTVSESVYWTCVIQV